MSDLAITKAAAWSWLQHGPDPLDSSNCEYGLTKAQRTHRPSRYKLEADKLIAQTFEGSCLLDRHDIETISKHINGYAMVNEHEARSEKKSGKKTKNKNSISKVLGAFWPMNGIVCVPREDDVVDSVREKSVNMVAETSGVKMIRPGTGWSMEGREGQARLGQRSERPTKERRHRPIAIPRPTIGIS